MGYGTPEFVTAGETMAVMAPRETGPLRYVRDYSLRMAGAESNTAVALAKLGHTAGWISRVGKDEMGEYLRNSVRAEGVDVSRVKTDPQHPTGLMLKQFTAGRTSVFYYRKLSAASCLNPDDIDPEYLRGAKILHLTGITPVLSDTCLAFARALLETARRENVRVSFDPNIRKKLWGDTDCSAMIREFLFASDIAMLGREEAALLLGTEDPEQIVRILREQNVSRIAVKDGSKGAWAADEEQICFIPPKPCHPVDPVGAGDAFNAGFLAGILENRDLAVCGEMGAIAGACATETPGDIEGCPSREEMDRILTDGSVIER